MDKKRIDSTALLDLYNALVGGSACPAGRCAIVVSDEVIDEVRNVCIARGFFKDEPEEVPCAECGQEIPPDEVDAKNKNQLCEPCNGFHNHNSLYGHEMEH